MPAPPLGVFAAVTVRFTLFALICLVGAELGQLIVVPARGIALPALWPPAGLLAAALILADRRHGKILLAIACGVTLVSTVGLHGRPVLPGIGLSIVFGVEASVVAWLVRRITAPGFTLNRVPFTWAFIVCATVVPIAGGALAASMLPFDGFASYFTTWRAWWLADTLGIIVTGSLLLAANTERQAWATIVRPWKAVEITVVFAGAVALAAGIFGDVLDPMIRVPAYILPFLLWPSLRFGPGGAAAALFVVSFIGLWNAAQGHGPFALVDAPAASLLLRSQGAMASAAVSLLLLASVVAERKQVALERAALVDDLRKALAEIKTLRGLIPICAWCQQIRDDAGFWQRIEMYLQSRTDATFSHGICPACAEQAHGEIASPDVTRRVS